MTFFPVSSSCGCLHFNDEIYSAGSRGGEGERGRREVCKLDFSWFFEFICPLVIRSRKSSLAHGMIDTDMPEVSYEALQVITDNFSEELQVGSGAYADVYKGSPCLAEGKENLGAAMLALLRELPRHVAVKRDHRPNGEARYYGVFLHA